MATSKRDRRLGPRGPAWYAAEDRLRQADAVEAEQKWRERARRWTDAVNATGKPQAF